MKTYWWFSYREKWFKVSAFGHETNISNHFCEKIGVLGLDLEDNDHLLNPIGVAERHCIVKTREPCRTNLYFTGSVRQSDDKIICWLVYLLTLSHLQKLYGIEWKNDKNEDWEGAYKEVVVACFRGTTRAFAERGWGTCHDNRSLSRESIPRSPVINKISVRFEMSTAMMIQIVVFWDVTLCSDAAPSSPWSWREHGPPKCWYPTSLHGVTTQKTTTWIKRVPQQWDGTVLCRKIVDAGVH
jgi:hypothetical protein